MSSFTFFFYNLNKNEKNLQDDCKNQGGYLAIIETEMENTWVKETFLPAWNPGKLPSLSASFILLSQSSLMFDRKRKSGK